MLKTKSMRAPIEATDGHRISVMSRHTLTDGYTPDPEITEKHFDEWWVDLAPLPRLVGAYYHRGLDWPRFEAEYVKSLRFPGIKHRVLELAHLALDQDVTILCVELTPEQCHRRLLAEEALRRLPDLTAEIA